MEQLDLKGLKCPLPILKTKKALAKLASGEQLCVFTTDESSPVDFEQFCYQTGHILQSSERIDNEYYRIVIQHK